MRVLRAVIFAIGMMGMAAACGGGNKGAQEPAPPAEGEGNPCAAPAEGGDEAAPAEGGDEKPAEGGGDEAANPCGGGEDM